MKYLIHFFILVFLIISSCKNEEKNQILERKTVHKNGIIKKSIIYKNKHNSSYVEVEQETNGHLLSIRKVVNGKMHGNYIIDDTNRNHIIVGSYNNDNSMRLYNVYNYDGNMIKEILENKNTQTIIASKHFGLMGQDNIKCFGVHNSKKEREGHYFINKSHEMIKSNQHKYYQVEARNIAFTGYDYKIKVKLLNEEGNNINGKLFYKSDTIDFKNKTAELIIHPKQKGYKIITGKIEVIEDTLINDVTRFKDYEYTFYHNFEVVDFYDYSLPFFEERNNYLYDFDTIPLVSKVLEWI